MNVGDRVTFRNRNGGKWAEERDGQEATITIEDRVDAMVRFDDGFSMYATAEELVAL